MWDLHLLRALKKAAQVEPGREARSPRAVLEGDIFLDLVLLGKIRRISLCQHVICGLDPNLATGRRGQL